MATFTRSDDLQEAQFHGTNLRGARFVDADLTGVVMRGVGLADADLDGPWLLDGRSALRERTWSATLERVATLPEGTVDLSVAGEWTFAETLRHLVLATDVWFSRAILGVDHPFHPLGLAGPEAAEDGVDMSVFSTETPTYAEVLAVRAEHQAGVRDFLAVVTTEELTTRCTNPWAPKRSEATLSCLHVILQEEWEHHRYAVRDLDVIEGG